jgi:hypothetical protein
MNRKINDGKRGYVNKFSALHQANPPSRFLCRDKETRLWEDVGDKRAAEKVGQLIRKNDEDKKIAKQTAFVKNAVTCRERDQATRWDGILIQPEEYVEPLVIQHKPHHPPVVPPPVDIQHPPSLDGRDAPIAIQNAPQKLPANPPNQTIPHQVTEVIAPPCPDAPLAIQVCKYYLENKCRYGDECRFSHSHDPTNGHLKNEGSFVRRRRGGRRYNKNKKSGKSL